MQVLHNTIYYIYILTVSMFSYHTILRHNTIEETTSELT
ncbi:hypothetical protein P278_10890 [Zhouia amylolytica AD3]|uniref:Uncharacterized protein n=1 Tax=Zhouia amylolytica AD3 TaxID=1286632 RepID=W2UPY7_9FLAO|nr:hypothetical protein P278_10890 [Zhouia amylolytica AD3]